MSSIDLNDDFGEMLFSGCPVLESLYLSYSDFSFSKISSKVLKILDLQDCNQLNPMQIRCLCLVSLRIDNLFQSTSISLENATSLENAGIRFDMVELDGDLNVLGGLSNVSTLMLDLWSPEAKVHCDSSLYL